MARQTIAIQNISAGALAIDLIGIPDNLVAVAATVMLTEFASVAEIFDDEQIHGHVDAGDAVLIVNGTTLNQIESQAALQPASSQTIVDEGPATAPVDSVFGRTGPVTAQNGDYTAAQVGADSTGTAAAAIAAHEAAPDPHNQYTTAAEASAAAPVQSVNGETGTVSLDAADVGADPTGTATAAVAAHEAALDPHSQYTTAAEAAAAAPVQSVNGETGTVSLDAADVGADPTGTATAAVASHEAAADPHPDYVLESREGVANGVATLDGTGNVPLSQLGNVASGLSYQGVWDASTNTPTLVSSTGTVGHYYVVSVAGSTNLDGITDWQPGDWAIFSSSNTWQKLDNSDAVTSVNGQQGAVVLNAGDVGADPTGTAAAAVAAHEAAADPHSQYTTTAEAAAAAPVQSVNGETGVVSLDAADVGADPTGTATAAIAAHEAAIDPHSQYTTTAEAAAAAPVQSVNGNTGAVSLVLGDLGGTIDDTQHGVRGGGTLHATAVPGTAGFMSGTDKSKLDGIETNATADQNASEVPVTDSLPEITGDVQQSLEALQTLIGSAVVGEIPAVVARRTTTLGITGTYTDVAFNETSVETDTTVAEHDNTNTDRLLLKEPGAYLIFFSTMLSCSGEPNVNVRVRLNDSTTLSDFPDNFFVDAGSATDFDWNLTRIGAVVTTGTGDFISLQVSETGGTNDITNVLFGAVRLRAPKGAQGDPGVATVIVQDDGVVVANGPFGTLNFVGATVTEAAGVASITFPTATIYRKAWGYTTATPTFTTTTITAPIANFSAPDGQFTESGGEFTSTFTGSAEISATVHASGGNRCRVETWIEVNGTEVPGSRTPIYIRNNTTWGSGTIPGIPVDLTSGDVVRLRVVRVAGGVTLTLRPNTNLFAKRIT